MKTLSIVSLAFLLMCTMNANAYDANSIESTHAANSEINLNSKFMDYIHLPEEYVKQGYNAEVDVLFDLDNSGKIENIICKSKEKHLSDYIIFQLRKIRFSELKSNVSYAFKIKFKVY